RVRGGGAGSPRAAGRRRADGPPSRRAGPPARGGRAGRADTSSAGRCHPDGSGGGGARQLTQSSISKSSLMYFSCSRNVLVSSNPFSSSGLSCAAEYWSFRAAFVVISTEQPRFFAWKARKPFQSARAAFAAVSVAARHTLGN